jgi:Na+/melibiose symporter-like transporter
MSEDVTEVKPLYFNRNFMLLMAARFVSQIGDRIHFFALTWYILNKIGTGSAVGTIMIFATAPSVIMGPFTGVLADRFDRRKIMIAMDAIRAIIAVTLGYLVIRDQAALWTLYLGTGLLAMCSDVLSNRCCYVSESRSGFTTFKGKLFKQSSEQFGNDSRSGCWGNIVRVGRN